MRLDLDGFVGKLAGRCLEPVLVLFRVDIDNGRVRIRDRGLLEVCIDRLATALVSRLQNDLDARALPVVPLHFTVRQRHGLVLARIDLQLEAMRGTSLAGA